MRKPWPLARKHNRLLSVLVNWAHREGPTAQQEVRISPDVNTLSVPASRVPTAWPHGEEFYEGTRPRPSGGASV